MCYQNHADLYAHRKRTKRESRQYTTYRKFGFIGCGGFIHH